MLKTPKYFVVEAQALPEIFLKVARAKQALELREAATVNEAAKLAGISRSAFYKYKDTIRPFNDLAGNRVMIFQLLLRDEPGMLSSLLNSFAASGVNILTINQTVPADGVAVVTVTAEGDGLRASLEELTRRLRNQNGVVKLEVLAG